MHYINPELFIETEIPKLHPHSYEYIEYWKEQKKRCIEGYWVGGKWCPPILYFYLNFGTILLNKGRTSKTKTPGRPLYFDFLEEVSYYWLEARGLTGFSKQKPVSQLLDLYGQPIVTEEEEKGIRKNIPNIRELLQTPNVDLGKPLYLNEAKDFVLMANRGPGKSYWVANGVVLHEFLFDGAKEYTEESIKNPNQIEIVVGAHDAKYSKDLLKKVKISYDNLPGGIMINDIYYPSPLYKQYSGSWEPSKEIIQKYKKKVGNKWMDSGSGSTIKHRTYGDNPFASQGTRPSVMVKEEVGMFNNLLQTWEADAETMKNGTYKFGSCLYLGTGGDMMGGGTADIKKMYYDPDAYNILAFVDDIENRGKIGYYLPATKGKPQYKDNKGVTNLELALRSEEKERERLAKISSSALNSYIQYNPIKPSEMFLMSNYNDFPVIEAQNTLAELESNHNYKALETVVELFFDPNSKTGVNYRVDTENKLKPITEFPLKDKSNLEGAVIIYEFPIEIDGEVPNDMYIFSYDTYRKDESGDSLGAIYVFKNSKYFSTHGGEEIVAEYIGRPANGMNVVNEILEKLWMMYGSPSGSIYFENEVGNTKDYFEKKKKLIALAIQPKSTLNKGNTYSKSNNVYGYPMSNKYIKQNSERYLSDWLKESVGESDENKNVLKVHKIKSRFLLKQLIMYNSDGNFDAVMSFMGCIIGLRAKFNEFEKEKEDATHVMDFLNNNKNLFPNGKHTKSTIII